VQRAAQVCSFRRRVASEHTYQQTRENCTSIWFGPGGTLHIPINFDFQPHLLWFLPPFFCRYPTNVGGGPRIGSTSHPQWTRTEPHGLVERAKQKGRAIFAWGWAWSVPIKAEQRSRLFIGGGGTTKVRSRAKISVHDRRPAVPHPGQGASLVLVHTRFSVVCCAPHSG